MTTVEQNCRGVVLVVDDDEDIRAEVNGFLESEHFLVFDARDGREALDILRSGAAPAIRLIVLDLAMPYMSGWELVDVLRNDPKLSRIPILITSGIPVHGDASGIGATLSWLRKPFDLEALLTAVVGAIESAPVSDRSGNVKIRERDGRSSLPSYH